MGGYNKNTDSIKQNCKDKMAKQQTGIKMEVANKEKKMGGSK